MPTREATETKMTHEPLEWGTNCLNAPDRGPHECNGQCFEKHVCLRCGYFCLCQSCNEGQLRCRSSVTERWVHTDTAIGRIMCFDPPAPPSSEGVRGGIKDRSEGVKMGSFVRVDPSPFPVDEKFTIYRDDKNDFVIQSQRETGLIAHGDTPEEAVYNMREVLDMAASLGFKTLSEAKPSPLPNTPQEEPLITDAQICSLSRIYNRHSVSSHYYEINKWLEWNIQRIRGRK